MLGERDRTGTVIASGPSPARTLSIVMKTWMVKFTVYTGGMTGMSVICARETKATMTTGT